MTLSYRYSRVSVTAQIYYLSLHSQYPTRKVESSFLDSHKTLATPSLCSTGKLIMLILQLIQEVLYRRFSALAFLLVCHSFSLPGSIAVAILHYTIGREIYF